MHTAYIMGSTGIQFQKIHGWNRVKVSENVGSHDFQSKRINFIAKKGKKFGQNRGHVVMTFKVSESISLLKRQKIWAKIGGMQS